MSPDDTTEPLPGYQWTQETHDAIQAGMPGGGISRLTQLAMGNDKLVTNPGLMDALYKGNASPQQASAINQYMTALDTEKQVKLARATPGRKLTLSAYQQGALDSMGVNYSDVVQTEQQAQKTFADQLAAKGQEVAKDQNGNVLLDASGQPIVQQKQPDPKKKNGWSFGRILHDVTHPLLQGWNLVDSSITGVSQDISNATGGMFDSTVRAGINQPTPSDTTSDQAHYAKLAGYDPNNLFSMLAYDASGKSHLPISHLAAEWDQNQADTKISGKDALDAALVFSANPEAYRRQIENDPSLDPQGKADKLAFISGEPFANLVRQVGGSTATVGNMVAKGAGLDPVTDGKLYSVTSAGVDFAASLIADPTILAGRVFSGLRLAQIGILDQKGAIDANKVRAIFSPLTAEDKAAQPFVAGVQRRWTNYLDQVKVLADDTAGEVEKAKAYQKIHSQFAELEPMTEHFTGARQVVGFQDGKIITGKATPITNLQDAGDYIASKMALASNVQGKAALETSLMPGATSLFGFRMLKGTAAERLAGHGQKIDLSRLSAATDVLPSSVNAISADGKVIAARQSLQEAQAALDAMKGTDASFSAGMKAFRDKKAATAAVTGAENDAATAAIQKAKDALQGDSAIQRALLGHVEGAEKDLANGALPAEVLDSARRAALANPAIRGEVENNMLRRGTADGQSFSLGGVTAARLELMSRRLGSLLPRNTTFRLDDAASQEKVYRYGLLYMNKGDAALMAAKWAAADEGQRRALISALQQQTLHAAGFGYTESGRAVLDKVESLIDNTTGSMNAEKSTTQRFTSTGKDTVPDPLLGGREAHYALFTDQLQKQWDLPSFAAIQRDAQKITIWEKVLGRAFTSHIADILMHGFKMIQLMKPSTYTRNALEGWANAVFRGDAAGGIRAKALGVEVERKVIAGLKRQATDEGWTKAQLNQAIDEHSPLQRQGWLSSHVPHLIMGQWYRSVLNKVMGDDAESQYILRLLDKPEEAKRMMDGFGLQHLLSDVDPAGTTHTLANSEAGLGSTPWRLGSKIDSWEVAATEGFDGAGKYSRALGIRLQSDPEYGKLLLDAAKKDDGNVSPLLDHIAMHPTMSQDIEQMRFSSLYQDGKGQWLQATSPADRQEALDQLVRRQVDDVKTYMTGKNGEWAQGIDDYFRNTGKVPDGDWIHKNLQGDARPTQVEAPVYVAAPLKQGAAGFVGALFNGIDKAYVRLVEDPIQRTTSMPLFLHNYGVARARFANYEKDLVETHGFTQEAADALLQEQAMKAAWVKTESIIDDPGTKAQFDVVGRNFFAYSRATQAMIRRWGQSIVQDPTRLTKATLALNAAEHSGMIWNDANGQMNFVFPGSGSLIELINDAMSHVPVLGNFMQIPTLPDLTGKVLLSVPGLENPFKLSATPLVNIPFREIERLAIGTGFDPQLPGALPGSDHLVSLMDEIDRTVNGPIGAGQIGSQFEPVALQKFITTFSKDNRNGMLASATIGALTNLIAGGHVPGADATDDQRQQFINNVRTNVRNQLFLRAIFGLWAPAPPSSPTNETAASKADFAFTASGIHGLDSEFKQMLNDMNGDYAQAVQVWSALHPDKLVYTQSKSTSKANKAYLPATTDALKWTEDNRQFIAGYKSVAGYFLPEYKGDFNASAYALQLSLGLRQKNTPEEFLNTALVNIARPQYQEMTKKYDDAITSATTAGDKEAVAALKTQRAAAVTAFNDNNPLYKAQRVGYETKALQAGNALVELKQMVSDPNIPKDVPTGAISEMLQSWDAYQSWKTANPSGSQAQNDARTLMAANFSQFMSQKAEAYGLTDLWNGVFRQLDNKLQDLSANN